MSPTGADRPVVRVSHYSISNRDAASTAGAVHEALAGVDAFVEPAVRGAVFRQRADQVLPIVDQVLAVDDAEPWTRLIEGRLPAPCVDGQHCEAILLSEAPVLDAGVVLNPVPGLELTVVGRGLVDDAVPFGLLDQRGPIGERPSGGTYQTGDERPALLLVVGLDAVAASPALEVTGRTYVWTAPLKPSAVHPWTVAAFGLALDATTRSLVTEDHAFSVASPIGTLNDELARARASGGRLVLIEALGVAILLAFAVFLGLVARADVAGETARLAAAGALGRHRVVFWVLEAAIPSATGAVVGLLAGAGLVAWLAARSGTDVGAVVSGSVLAPDTIAGVRSRAAPRRRRHRRCRGARELGPRRVPTRRGRRDHRGRRRRLAARDLRIARRRRPCDRGGQPGRRAVTADRRVPAGAGVPPDPPAHAPRALGAVAPRSPPDPALARLGRTRTNPLSRHAHPARPEHGRDRVRDGLVREPDPGHPRRGGLPDRARPAGDRARNRAVDQPIGRPGRPLRRARRRRIRAAGPPR